MITLGLIIIAPITDLTQHAVANSVSVQTADIDFVHGSFENVKINGTGEDANLRLNVNKGWIKKEISDTPKLKKYHDMASICDTDKSILLSSTGEIFIYNQSNNSWYSKNKYGPFNENYDFAVSPIFNTKCMLLYGGHAGIWSSSNTYLYNLTTNYWYNLQPDLRLGARSYHSMAPIYGTDKVLMFGGGADIWSSDNSTCIYDYSDNNWVNMKPDRSPQGRIKQALAPISGTDKVLLFGGERVYNITVYNSSNNSTEIHVIRYTLNDTWVYDLSKNIWTNITPLKSPGPRIDHELENVGDQKIIILFGGKKDNTTYSDTWCFKSDVNKWVKIKTKNTPSTKCSYSMSSIYGTDKVLIYIGINSNWRDDSGWKDETWIYKYYFDTINGIYVSQPLDMGKNATFQILKWSAITPVNTRIQIQLKTSSVREELSKQIFHGPNGGGSTYYSISPSKIWSGHDGDRWLQYKIYFNTSNRNEYAVLKGLTITYNLHPEVTLLTPKHNQKLSDNRPKFKWKISDDSEDQQAFQILIDDNISFSDPNFDTGVQESSLQEWQFSFNTGYNLITDGIWYCKIRVRDNEGAWGSYSNAIRFVIDSIPPRSRIITPEDKGIYRFIEIISIEGINIYNGSHLSMVEIQIQRLSDGFNWNGESWSNNKVWLKTIFMNDWLYDPLDIKWDQYTRYKIKSRAIDSTGNREVLPDEVSFYIDNKDPCSIIEYPNRYWLDKLSMINGTSNDQGSDIEYVRIQIKDTNANTYWTGTTWDTDVVWINVEGTENWSYESDMITWESGKEYTIKTRAVDKMGNIEISGDIIDFSFDYSGPRTKQFFINEGSKYTRSRDINLQLKAEDELSGIQKMCFSKDSHIWSPWLDYNEDHSMTLPDKDGEYIIYSKLMDFAFNIGKVKNDSIILDTQLPYNLSVYIENKSGAIESQNISLRLDAADALSGVSRMSFNLDDTKWSDWEVFKTKRIFDLPNENGKHTIYFRVMDHAGNVADPVSLSFVIKTRDKAVSTDEGLVYEIIPNNEYDEDLPVISITWILGSIIFMIFFIIIIFNMYNKINNNIKEKEKVLKKINCMKHCKIKDKVINAQIFNDHVKFNQDQNDLEIIKKDN
jgi:hypothetical protein